MSILLVWEYIEPFPVAPGDGEPVEALDQALPGRWVLLGSNQGKQFELALATGHEITVATARRALRSLRHGPKGLDVPAAGVDIVALDEHPPGV